MTSKVNGKTQILTPFMGLVTLNHPTLNHATVKHLDINFHHATFHHRPVTGCTLCLVCLLLISHCSRFPWVSLIWLIIMPNHDKMPKLLSHFEHTCYFYHRQTTAMTWWKLGLRLSHLLYCQRFLQRVSIACYAKRCTSYRKSVCLSVCLSVRLSVTRWHCVKTTQATIMGSSL